MSDAKTLCLKDKRSMAHVGAGIVDIVQNEVCPATCLSLYLHAHVIAFNIFRQVVYVRLCNVFNVTFLKVQQNILPRKFEQHIERVKDKICTTRGLSRRLALRRTSFGTQASTTISLSLLVFYTFFPFLMRRSVNIDVLIY